MKKLTTIELVEGDGPPTIHWVGTSADGERIEHVIRELANMRRDHSPPVPLTLDTRKPVAIEADVSFLIGKDHTGRPLMSFRHPGFGWTTFRLEPGLVKYLKEELQNL